MKHFKLLILFALALTTLVFVQQQNNRDQTWNVLFSTTPSKLTIDQGINYTSAYLLWQTHSPLFRKDADSSFVSPFLSSFNRSRDSKNYQLCIKGNVFFDEAVGSRFDVKYLKAFLTSKSKKLWVDNKIDKISTNNNCLNVSFEQSNKVFFYKLSKLIHSPSIRVNGQWDAGLGEFKVSSMSPEKIVLDRKNKVKAGYNKIVALNAKINPEYIKDKTIEDINNLYAPPKWAKIKYRQFPITETQTVNLVLNIENKKLRNLVYNCLDVKKFRLSLTDNKKPYINIGNLLPIGYTGSDQALPKQSGCNSEHPFKGAHLTFMNWLPSSQERLEVFFSDFYKQTGVKVSVEPLKNTSLADEFSAKKHNYNLVPISINSTDNSYECFFENFTDEVMTVIDNPLLNLNNDVRLVDSITSENQKLKTVNKLVKKLADANVYLPLYQSQSLRYYPKHIELEQYNFSKLIYPPVASFEL